MKIVSTSYINTRGYTDPEKWLERISFYTGLLEELAVRHEVESIEQINYSGQLKMKGVTYHFLDFKKKKLYFPLALHRYIKKLKPDVVFVNGFIFPLQVIQLRHALGKDVKIIILHRAEKPFDGLKRLLQRVADNSVSGYLFVSHEFGEEWISKGIIRDKDKIHEVIQSSSSFQPGKRDEARSSLNISGEPIFLWVGRLDRNKDPLTVIKAFKQYHSARPVAKLYMIYHSEQILKEVKEISAEYKDAIQLIGKVDHPQLEAWYNAADFFISGSHYEGSGISACEAMSCGCIPILTNIISFRKMTGPGKCGLLYQAGNSGALLSVLLKTQEINIALEKEKTIKQFRKELSFEAIGQKIENVIDSI